tara:strand:- start:24340 stop:25260 length:921 start_codon:yes stop_codon:yes gene_type:complete
MRYQDLYKDELTSSSTGYFILDTKGERSTHVDVDFTKYSWRKNKYNLVNVGDLFVYRRPGTSSETKKFYFFGAGKIENITPIGPEKETRVEGLISKPYPFISNIGPDDLEDYSWKVKERQSGSWEHFFNQYGMNKITKDDFLNIIGLSEGADEYEYDSEAATRAAQDIQQENYYVDDEVGEARRRSKQGVFANQVKSNYKNKCAICGISTKPFLVGSHIVPWSKDKSCRLDPANGIALCVMHDKLFDCGFITLDDDLKIIVSNVVSADENLLEYTDKIKGKKIKKPTQQTPKKAYLKYHRDIVFKK